MQAMLYKTEREGKSSYKIKIMPRRASAPAKGPFMAVSARRLSFNVPDREIVKQGSFNYLPSHVIVFDHQSSVC